MKQASEMKGREKSVATRMLENFVITGNKMLAKHFLTERERDFKKDELPGGYLLRKNLILLFYCFA